MKSRHFKTVAQDSIKPEPASNGKIRMRSPSSNAKTNGKNILSYTKETCLAISLVGTGRPLECIKLKTKEVGGCEKNNARDVICYLLKTTMRVYIWFLLIFFLIKTFHTQSVTTYVQWNSVQKCHCSKNTYIKGRNKSLLLARGFIDSSCSKTVFTLFYSKYW